MIAVVAVSGTMSNMSIVGLFLLLAGFVVGLGAVTVIDLHGFLGRSSPYWTEATIRTHKVTKPLIWLGMTLVLVGGVIFYKSSSTALSIHICSVLAMLLNGSYLSFVISPCLLKQERDGRAQELLPQSLQQKIMYSFIASFILWWGNLLFLVWYLNSALG